MGALKRNLSTQASIYGLNARSEQFNAAPAANDTFFGKVGKSIAAAGLLLGSSLSFGQTTGIDEAAVIDSIEVAGQSGISVGQAVVGVIALFVAVGVIIGMTRRLG